MEYIYAAMLIHKAGKKVDEAILKKVLEATGVHPDDAKVKSLVSSLSDIDIDKVIKESTLVAAPTAAPAEAKAGEKKEEKPKEEKKSTEEAAAGLGALFG